MKRKILSIFLTLVLVLGFSLVTAAPVGAVEASSVFQSGGDRLVEMLNSDGGWGWPLTGPSADNTLGPIGIGLAETYQQTNDSDHLAALGNVGTFLLTKTNNFTCWDGYLAVQLDSIFGGTPYTDFVKANFYDKLAAGNYERDDSFTYDTEGYIAAAGYAWDLGIGLISASSVGIDQSEIDKWITGVTDAINILDTNDDWYPTDLAGGLYGLAYADETEFAGSGTFEDVTTVAELAVELASLQENSGVFDPGHEMDIQNTAYALLALNEVDRPEYIDNIAGAGAYLDNTQLETGGWENYAGEGENNEMTAEALWALAYAPVRVTIGETGFYSIQSAINSATEGNTVNVAAGTYAEDLVIPAGKDNLELAGAAGATIKGVATFPDADFPGAEPNIEIMAVGVKIHGFTIKGPLPVVGEYAGGMLIGAADVEISYNDFKVTAGKDAIISAAGGSGAPIAIQTYRKNVVEGVDISGLDINNNTFTDLGGGLAGYDGIFINLDTGTGTITIGPDNDFTGNVFRAISTERSNTVISGNDIITDLAIYTGTAGGFQGMYIGCYPVGEDPGLLQTDVSITGNTVEGSDASKGFKQGIRIGHSTQLGLDDIIVSQNTVQGNNEGIAVKAPADVTPVDVVVNYNDIVGNTSVGVKIYGGTTVQLDATSNWWGDATGADPVTETNNPHGANAAGDVVSDNVDFTPWYATATTTPDTDYVSVDHPTPAGTIIAYSDTIQGGIDAALSGDTITVAAGMYVEAILIDKPLILRGATADVNKNGYTVPADYAWDDTVESIINHPDPSGGYTTIVDIVDVDNVTFEGFVVQELDAVANLNSSLVSVYAHTKEISNIVVRNNVIGPNTNVTSQDGTHGRMGLYIVNYPYSDLFGVVNSTFSGNKLFDCKGNGTNVFIWSTYYDYTHPDEGPPTAAGPASMSGTVIEDNEIYGSHRSGIETAGGFSGLIIRNNKIYGNSGLSSDDPDMLKYGHGILLIRGTSDRVGDPTTAYGPEDLTIENNEIYDNEKSGIYMGPINKNYSITGNNIHDNGWDGIMLDLVGQYWNPTFESAPDPYDENACYDGSTNIVANSNNIYSNTEYGVRVVGTPTNGFVLDATDNWWDHASGPIPPGTYESYGDKVSDNVDYEPWLLAEVVPEAEPTTYEKTLALKDGWTLVSTDKAVADVAWVGTEGPVAAIYALKYALYTDTGNLAFAEATTADLEPLTAIYVQMQGSGGVGFNYAEDGPTVYTKELEAGWNLISTPSMAEGTAGILSPLCYVTVGTQQVVGLTALVSQGDYNQFSDSFYEVTLTEDDWNELQLLELDPFDGYWANMEAADTFEVIPVP